MALVAPDVGEAKMLEIIVNKTAPANLVMHLYTNNVDPTENTISSDFNEVSGISGYTPVTLTGAAWTISTVSNVTTAQYAAQQFNMLDPVTCYGYYMTGPGAALMWAERFAGGPFVLPVGGGTIEITPKVTLD